jgi:hypothetical protein
VLLEKALNRPIEIITKNQGKVDIEIESVYGKNEVPNFSTRVYRFISSHSPSGINFSKPNFSTNQQPSGNARYTIFFTGENERPPFGSWDAYLTFDQHSYGGKNAYLPLWWLTSCDLIMPTVSPYLGKAITLDEMLAPREANYRDRDKFCVAFIGKAYPFRMHAIAELSKIGKVDVYGGIARNQNSKAAQAKFETAQRYRFVFAFENDLFPGYVTEKAPEAWATGAIPLYWGSDPQGFLNQNSMINLTNYSNLEDFVAEVSRVNDSMEEWTNIAQRPLLNKRPSLDKVIEVLRRALRPLIAEIK